MGGGGEIRPGGTRSFGQTKSFGGESVTMLANGVQAASLSPSRPVGDVRAALDLRAGA